MFPYHRFKSVVAALAVLIASRGAMGGVSSAIDNYTDESAIVLEPTSFESESEPEVEQKNMVAPPAMVYYLEITRNRVRQPVDLLRKELQSKSYLASRPFAALVGKTRDGRKGKLGRQREAPSSSLVRGVALIRRRAAEEPERGIDSEDLADRTSAAGGYLDKDDADCSDDLMRGGGIDARCRSLKVNPDEQDVEQMEKRREFVVDLGKRFDDFRTDLGKRFLNDRQKYH